LSFAEREKFRPQVKNKLLLLLVLLMMAATGAWAQAETLLTTIKPTGQTTHSETTPGVVTVTHDNNDFSADYGWLWDSQSGSLTVEAKEGYTITRCVFKQNSKTPVTVSSAPFKVSFIETANPSHPNQKKFLCQGDWNLNMNGVSSIEVYGYAPAPAPPTYSVTLAEGTEDGDKWTISPAEAAEGDKVTVTYSGEKKVKSVKAVKKAATIPVTSITLNKTATTISAGNTETLSVTAVAPDNATDKTYTWKTSDASIATVDQDGKVTAVALGTVIIYAEANDGSGVKGSCTVTVSKVVTINQSDWGERGQRSFTKDGVTVSADMIDPEFGELGGNITISTTLGIFSKIVVTAEECYASGTGWSGNHSSMTWAGIPASTVSFRGEFEGRGSNPTTIVCTIVP
jgi:uncharacterized protein YjdB